MWIHRPVLSLASWHHVVQQKRCHTHVCLTNTPCTKMRGGTAASGPAAPPPDPSASHPAASAWRTTSYSTSVSAASPRTVTVGAHASVSRSARQHRRCSIHERRRQPGCSVSGCCGCQLPPQPPLHQSPAAFGTVQRAARPRHGHDPTDVVQPRERAVHRWSDAAHGAHTQPSPPPLHAHRHDEPTHVPHRTAVRVHDRDASKVDRSVAR